MAIKPKTPFPPVGVYISEPKEFAHDLSLDPRIFMESSRVPTVDDLQKIVTMAAHPAKVEVDVDYATHEVKVRVRGDRHEVVEEAKVRVERALEKFKSAGIPIDIDPVGFASTPGCIINFSEEPHEVIMTGAEGPRLPRRQATRMSFDLRADSVLSWPCPRCKTQRDVAGHIVQEGVRSKNPLDVCGCGMVAHLESLEVENTFDSAFVKLSGNVIFIERASSESPVLRTTPL